MCDTGNKNFKLNNCQKSSIVSQLKDIDEKNIKNKVKKMIGTDDQDIIDTFETLIDLVINTVSKNKTGELDDIINSFESDASTLDKNKMKKTVGAFTKCLWQVQIIIAICIYNIF